MDRPESAGYRVARMFQSVRNCLSPEIRSEPRKGFAAGRWLNRNYVPKRINRSRGGMATLPEIGRSLRML